MKSIQTEIMINASAEKVWNILTDFSRYHEWNPFIQASAGEAREGTRLSNTMHLEGQKPQTFKPLILEVKPNRSLRWLGSLFIKGLFDGEHYFQLESMGNNQTRLLHGERFGGILSGMILKMIGEASHKGFLQMNEALKTRAEQL